MCDTSGPSPPPARASYSPPRFRSVALESRLKGRDGWRAEGRPSPACSGGARRWSACRREVAQLGPSELRVHVFGETGTGKEMVARALHDALPRARRPLRARERGRLHRRAVRGRSCSATRAGPSRARSRRGRATWRRPRAARSSSTRWRRCRRSPRCGSCASSQERRVPARRRDGSPDGRRAGDQRDERRPRRGACGRDASARTCGTGSRRTGSSVPPLRERGDDVLLLARHFLRARRPGARRARARAVTRRRRRRSSATPGRATCASSRARCSGWRCGPRGRAVDARGPLARAAEPRARRRRRRCGPPCRQCEAELVRDALERHARHPRARRRGARHHPPGALGSRSGGSASSARARERCYPRRPSAEGGRVREPAGGRKAARVRRRACAHVAGSWRLLSVVLLSFSSGLPLGVVWFAIPAWMARVGVDIKVIGLFTLAQAPWSFKLLWSPWMDRFPPPFLGRKRGWILIGQVALFAVDAVAGRRVEPPRGGVGDRRARPRHRVRLRDPGHRDRRLRGRGAPPRRAGLRLGRAHRLLPRGHAGGRRGSRSPSPPRPPGRS